ncbi:MAG: ROK family protein [Anaerolineae bacterium]|nr:ROK family protein [Anaerolineae bacterium]
MEVTLADFYGGIEAGGTEFVCAVAADRGSKLADKTILKTTSPEETLNKVITFFQGYTLNSLGIACFGPVDLANGRITTTPKTEWIDTEIVRPLHEALGVPIRFDTDVNGAALGESRHGAGQGNDPLVYMTIGTGIGAGILVNGTPIHGLIHPEAGHMPVRRHPDDPYQGGCPYHGDCLEGLASGPAIERRWGRSPRDLSPDHEAWPLQAYYLAQAMCTLVCVVSPRRIILGGGVMNQLQLFPLIRAKTRELLGGYINSPAILTSAIEQFIVPPELGDNAGIVGALELAFEVWDGDRGVGIGE